MSSPFISPDAIRSLFCSALSSMYRTEVPLYGDLVQLVDEVNAEAIAKHDGFEGEELKREMEESKFCSHSCIGRQR
jgi:uncharacterized glyoxalase superfamily metalloenzyme YdcJ